MGLNAACQLIKPIAMLERGVAWACLDGAVVSRPREHKAVIAACVRPGCKMKKAGLIFLKKGNSPSIDFFENRKIALNYYYY